MAVRVYNDIGLGTKATDLDANQEQYAAAIIGSIVGSVAKIFWSKQNNKSGYGYTPDPIVTETKTIPENFAGLEAEMVPTRLMNQLFRIYDVDEGEDYVTIRARHVWYDNLTNFSLWKGTENTDYTGAEACRNVLENALFDGKSRVASDCRDTLKGSDLDFERKNLVECFLDPEKGICARYGLSLIRYNWDFYCLKEVGYNRGFVVESRKNLLGVDRHEITENVVTRVAAYGKKDNGDILWLNNNGVKWVDSEELDPLNPRAEILDTGLQIGKDDVTANNIQAKMLEAAEKRFSEDHADLPEIEMTVRFLSLGDTEEYKQYRDLDKVYLFDILSIKDAERGYQYTAQVVSVEHDILTGMLTSVKIGKLDNWDGTRKIAKWQVPEISGENIRLKSILSGSFAAGAIQSEDIGPSTIQYAHFASATIDDLVSTNITAVTANIHEIIAGSITAQDITTGSLTADVIAAGAITTDKLAAGAVTANKIDAGAITTEKLAAGSITAGKIAANAITTEKLAAGSITAGKIAAGAITTEKLDAYAVTAAKIAAGAVTTDKLDAGAITADKISATDLSAINAKLGTATIAQAEIATADINFAHIKDLSAESAYFGEAIFDEAVGGKLYVPRLAVGYAQMLGATIGDLVIQASNGNFYGLDVDLNGEVVATQRTVTAGEIASGHTTDGRTLVLGTDILATDLNTENIYASHALMSEITAAIINVDQLWAREAFVGKLMTTNLMSNTYIQATVGNWTSGSTITQTIDSLDTRISELGYGTIYMQDTEPSHSSLVAGDVWVQTLPTASWNDINNNYSTWQDIYENVSSWQVLAAMPKMYVWDGLHWQELYDSLLPENTWTEIEQLSYQITLRATTSQVDALGNTVDRFAAELTVQSQQIEAAVSAVDTKASSYVMWADPRTAYTVSIGDIWVKQDANLLNWQDLYDEYATWQAVYDLYTKWLDLLGATTYVWNGSEWVQSDDIATEIYNATRITETEKSISLVATQQAMFQGELITVNAQITVLANEIRQEVSRATTAEGGKLEKTGQYQTASDIVTEAVRQSASSAGETYIAKTNTLITADGIVTEAVKQSASKVSAPFSKTTAYEIGDMVSYEGKVYKFKVHHNAGNWNSAHVDEVKNVAGSFIAKTTNIQTAEDIILEAVTQAGDNADDSYVARSGQYITATDIITESEKRSARKVAPAFSNMTTYHSGDIVSYNGDVYKFKTTHNAGDWNSSHVDQLYGITGSVIAKTSRFSSADRIYDLAVEEAGRNTASGYIAKAGTLTTAYSIEQAAEIKASEQIVPAFSTGTTYYTGDYVSYNGEVYKFKQTHNAGAWNPNHVDKKKVADYVADKAYLIRSGIQILAAGIQATGDKYIYLDVVTGTTYVHIDRNGIDMKGAGISVSGDESINLDVNQNNYVHMSKDGIDMKGSRVRVNGNDMWARDDIIIMNPNATDSWRRTVAGIESHMSGKHDWVLIRPFYDASINYVGVTGQAQTETPINNQYTESGSSGKAFGGQADWYNYAITLNLQNNASLMRQLTVQVFLANKPFSFDSSAQDRRAAAAAQANVILPAVTDTIAATGTKTLNLNSGHVGYNLCGENENVYYYIYGLNYDGMLINGNSMAATTDQTNGRVPCSTYYYS